MIYEILASRGLFCKMKLIRGFHKQVTRQPQRQRYTGFITKLNFVHSSPWSRSAVICVSIKRFIVDMSLLRPENRTCWGLQVPPPC